MRLTVLSHSQVIGLDLEKYKNTIKVSNSAQAVIAPQQTVTFAIYFHGDTRIVRDFKEKTGPFTGADSTFGIVPKD